MTIIDIAIAAALVFVTYIVGHRRGVGSYRTMVEQRLQEVYREARGDRSLSNAVRRLRYQLFWPGGSRPLEPPKQ